MLTGCGLGLRALHIETILTTKPNIPWFEILADNFLQPGSLAPLLEIREHYPLTQHSVGMSLGSTDPLDWNYLSQLRDLADLIQPELISDHLCFVSVGGNHFHDLLPLPYTAEAAIHVAERIQQIQDFFGRQIAIENVSSYLTYKHSEMSEAEFIAAVAEQSDCQILLDINNAHVNSVNHQFNLTEFFAKLPAERIKQFHLGGHESRTGYLLDTHGSAIAEPVWQAYFEARELFGERPTLIEWDNNIPEFGRLAAEAERCR